MRRIVTVSAVTAVLLVGTVLAIGVTADRHLQARRGDAAIGAAVVTVHAGISLGLLNNPSRYQNQAGPVAPLGRRALRLVDDLDPKVTRVWIPPGGYYDATKDRYDFNLRTSDGSTMYEYLDQVAGHTDQILANIDQCQQELMSAGSAQHCATVLERGIEHYKRRYPNLKYIEVFNEPDRDADKAGALSVKDYYGWYQTCYEIVNRVNKKLRPKVPLRIGGPATERFNETYLRAFLDAYRADANSAKRLDFISYHQYQRRSDPAAVAGEKGTIGRWLAERELDPDTPVFVTEYGVFPGTNMGTTFEADLLTQAAALATLGYYYGNGRLDMPMHWVFNHTGNERKSMFVDEVDGAVYPYYNVVRMQRMLKAVRVMADSDALTADGLGVNALATRDASGVAVLTTNYQWTTGKRRYNVRMDVENLPPAFEGRQFRVDRYLVDATTSNYMHDRQRSKLERVEGRTMAAARSFSTTFEVGANAVSLVVLTPVD